MTKLTDDSTSALEDIRRSGERLLDEFIKLERKEMDELYPHLEKLRREQNEVLRIIEAAKK